MPPVWSVNSVASKHVLHMIRSGSNELRTALIDMSAWCVHRYGRKHGRATRGYSCLARAFRARAQTKSERPITRWWLSTPCLHDDSAIILGSGWHLRNSRVAHGSWEAGLSLITCASSSVASTATTMLYLRHEGRRGEPCVPIFRRASAAFRLPLESGAPGQETSDIIPVETLL